MVNSLTEKPHSLIDFSRSAFNDYNFLDDTTTIFQSKVSSD